MPLRSRIVPCLLIDNGRLVNTRKFKEDKYIGDPINAVRIFNEKEVDELSVIDISATRDSKGPDLNLIRRLARESRMPLCYCGGISSSEQARELVRLGVEKVGISSALIERPSLVTEISRAVGRQSVVAIFDVKKSLFGKYELYTNNGTRKVKGGFENTLKKINELGVGEVLINSIDHDGEMDGYDLTLAKKVRDWVDGPLTILGGAGSKEDFGKLERECGVIGAAAGSLFVYKGKYRAVLINYLTKQDRIYLGMRV